MGKPAARVGDMHVCPMQTPGVPPIPHVGGPILPPGVPTVLIGGMPAAVMGGMAVCVGPPDSIILGSMGVLIGGQPAARMGDSCSHGGTIILGCPTVLIGDMSPGSPPVVVVTPDVASPGSAAPATSRQASALKKAAERGVPLCEVCDPAKEEAKKKEEKKTFVAIELKDEDGLPKAGAKYRVTLPDGSVKEGFLDLEGKAKVEGVDPGNCKITFPDLYS